MILVKWMIACLHACRSVMPQEVKIPWRNNEKLSVWSSNNQQFNEWPNKLTWNLIATFHFDHAVCDHLNKHTWQHCRRIQDFRRRNCKAQYLLYSFHQLYFFWTRRLRLCCHQSKLFITAGVVVNVSSVQRRQQWTRTAGLELGSETNRWKDRSAN